MNRIPIVILNLVLCLAIQTNAQTTTYKISPKVIAGIDDKLFGQFMEKPSWESEIGGDAAIDKKTGKVLPQVMQYLKEMNLPMLRYPGGTDVDYYAWYNLIDNVPNHHEKRPAYRNYSGDMHYASDNRLGLDQFLRLCKELKSEPLLVVNIGDAFYKKITIAEASENAAGMVAYCNLKRNKSLPEGATNWVSVRKKNGQKNPYGVKYFEVGNEPWLFFDRLPKGYNRAEAIAHYMNCLEAIVNAMRAVDPSIQIITDGEIKEVCEQLKSRMGNKINFIAFHSYLPWGIGQVKQEGKVYPVKDMTENEIWNAWVSTPFIDSNTGLSAYPMQGSYAGVRQTGYPIACTEWNWNGWWQGQALNEASLNSRFAKGIGVAGFVHALMRDAAYIQIGNQSMLVGNKWDITAIHVDTLTNEARFFPTGKVLGFYSRFHGDQLLDLQTQNLTYFIQPFELSGIKPSFKVAYIDALATRSKNKLYFHAINRNYTSDMEITLDLSALKLKPEYVHHLFSSTDVKKDELGYFKDEKRQFKGSAIKIVLPKQSVSILEFNITD